MNLFETINNDIKSAMLAKEKEKLEALRAVKAAFLLAKSEKGAADELSSETEIKIIQKLVKQRKESAEVYKTNNRMDLYEKEVFEASVIEKYLPQQLSEDEIVAQLKTIVAQIGAKGPQDMGKVMGLATKHFAGKAEGKVVAEKVKQVLAGL
ncbi:MAG TPA: glutamyl-tRNA amidotransferase [Marinilabiliales bacterium]|jgi:hypothetical protein|nr:MAG: glutamyl-tRNA amidotransferase [Bacteroidetes bacterium GWA2_40_14]OFX65153.1 MAG: glutamyl-tRNA amidotransferase [Bacteroidetes bacterium GWC2_40_13]OFX74329.1 MAG: glutamyl-tRNA amidotransferase [Bacteroidetes bacterium GWD2_40_43]OFX90936.1 MAG: glutamyl-tRNA amidotransferase [Bacteroidetes bacterium GWE2_40_63]OFY21150.1 MAG: glutamyl-tRNA amidotransferase [Bacteroidetes bacterium GWF2_40_13]OFZ25371.1 MAG: glutamyl-tRNA amidotransferase [Bacteroidetes bacterium RIFOXYC2_FULL_40_12